MTKFQKYLLGFLLIFLLVIVVVILRQQEISRCKSFYSERNEKVEGRIDFLRFNKSFSASYNWCDWILYGWQK